MTLHKGLYDRLIYEDEVGELASLSGQHRALVAVPTAHQRREQFIAELVHRLPELLDAAAAGQPNASEKAKGYWGQRDIGVKSCRYWGQVLQNSIYWGRILGSSLAK